jgi:uncharacterized protein
MVQASDDRIHVIDALRGFALWGIVIVHMVEQFLGGYPPPGMGDYAVHAPIDLQVKAVNRAIFLSKFFTIFSLLFGLSFFIQMDRAGRRGQPFAGKFLWRLVLLFFIGVFHNLFFRGDILTVYALLGFVLVVFYRLPSWVILLTASGIILGLPRYLVLWAKLRWGSAMSMGERAIFEAANTHYFQVAKNGGLFDIFALNIWDGWLGKMAFQFDIFGRGYLTFAMFLLGLWLGRNGFFEQFSRRKHTLYAVFVGGLLVAYFLFPVHTTLLKGFDGRSWRTIIGLTIQDISNLSISSSIVSAFLILFTYSVPRKFLGVFEPYGRMALSNYIGQTIAGTFVFFGWGLGLIGSIGAGSAVLIGQGITALQIVASKIWLRYFRYGPLEWLWRSGTYLKWQPLKKKQVGGGISERD